MKVLALFDPAYTGPASGAVWLKDTQENRAWFERHHRTLETNSALFLEGLSPDYVIRQIVEHYPDWTEIVVVGLPAPAHIAEAAGPDAVLTNQASDGFNLSRR